MGQASQTNAQQMQAQQQMQTQQQGQAQQGQNNGAKQAGGWFCPECGGKNTGKFCMECGTPKPAGNTCPSCNAELKPGAKFCSECGAKI